MITCASDVCLSVLFFFPKESYMVPLDQWFLTCGSDTFPWGRYSAYQIYTSLSILHYEVALKIILWLGY